MKIGYVIKMFPRISETFILNEILELERQGIEIVIFSLKKPNEGRFHQQLARLKAPVFYLEDLDIRKWPSWLSPEWPTLKGNSHRLFEQVGQALAENDPARVDLLWQSAWIAARAEAMGVERLHAHFASLTSTVAHFAHLISGIPYSFTAHAKDIFVYSMEEHFLKDKLHAASFVVTVTNFNRNYLMNKAPNLDPSQIRVIHNGIHLDQFAEGEHAARDNDLILAVGRLVPKKGFATLLHACALLKSRGVRFRCLIVGDGPESAALQEQRVMLGLEREVSFAGALVVDQVRQLMQSATVFCLPCTVTENNDADALPTVLLEALACGLPSVSTSISGVPEIIDSGRDGILVSSENPVELAEQVERLLSSPELRRTFSAAGRKKAEEKFDIHQNVGTLVRAFTEDSARMATGKSEETCSRAQA